MSELLPNAATSLVSLLRARAERQPELPGFTFLEDGETDATTATYARLDAKARAIAATLQECTTPGDRALLLYPPGIDYIAAFFGCLYAGVIAVPAYPPNPARLERTLPRLQAIAEDARPAVALTTGAFHAFAEYIGQQYPGFAAMRWLSFDEVPDARASDWRERRVAGSDLAFLQYTSGSTSTPKGVMLTHDNLLHNSAFIGAAFQHTPDSRGVIWLPPYHDMGLIGGIIQPLYAGFPVVLMSPVSFLQRPLRWLSAISEYRATTSGGPNFAYDLCVRKTTPEQRERLDLSSWQIAFNGAEPIRAATLARFADAFAPAQFRPQSFFPCYGLAEATLLVAGGPAQHLPTIRHVDVDTLAAHRPEETAPDTGMALVGSGTLVEHTAVRVVGADGQVCAPGTIGELWVRGPGVAQGYWDRPAATAETFHARIAGETGTFLRTGDLGFLHEGQVFVTGRSKDLIIIRGRNIYPHDIEATAEQSHPGLRPGGGAAVAVEIDGEERLVVVHEIERAARTSDLADITTAVRQAVVARHEVPLHAVVLLKPGTIPKTSSGKIQRYACRAGFLAGTLGELFRDTSAPAADDVLPADTVTPDEIRAAAPAERPALLAAYIAELLAAGLGVPAAQIDSARPLSALGIDSLLAIESQHTIETALGVELPMTALLDDVPLHMLAAQLASALDAAPIASSAPAEIGTVAASVGQQALWFLHELAPTSTAYHLAQAATMRGPLDLPALREAVRLLAERHPALRTTFGGTPPRRTIHPAHQPALPLTDARGWGAPAVQVWLAEQAALPFDLADGPLFRIGLLHHDDTTHTLLFCIHHIIADMWSMQVLFRDLAALYVATSEGHAAALPPLPQTYTGYVEVQTALLNSPAAEQHWRYWRNQLADAPDSLDLPTDYPRTVGGQRGGRAPLHLDAATVASLRTLARQMNTTLYNVVLSGFYAFLYRWTGQRDLLVGTPTTGRERADWRDLVGYLVNPLPIRAQVRGTLPFTALVAQVRQTLRDALAHQSLPFPLLVERLRPQRDGRATPLVQVMLTWQQAGELGGWALGDGAPLPFHNLTLESQPLPATAPQFDLSLMLAEVEQGLAGIWHYDADLFEPATVAHMSDLFASLLTAIAADASTTIGAIPLPGAVVPLPATPAASPALLHELVEAQVGRTPDAVAVVAGGASLTYGELWRRAGQCARLLQTQGVRSGDLVGVHLERSLELPVALLGILRAGAAYIPLDPGYPAERLALMLDDARPRVVLTSGHPLPDGPWRTCDLTGQALAEQPADVPALATSPDALAYVIYTSGSTGRPKGVMISHRAIVNHMRWMARAFPLGPADVVLFKTPISFDASVWKCYAPLMAGARLVLAPTEAQRDPAVLAQVLAETGATVLQLVPTLLHALLQEPRSAQIRLRRLFCGGEALPLDLARRAQARFGAEIVNLYGPTEATIDATAHVLADDHSPTVPIGAAVDGVQAYVLDDDLNPVPVGAAGELFLAGVQLAHGYLNQPALTAERFLPDPFAGGRMYRTGDRVRRRADGALVFLGRRDQQVKLRGMRLELGEIEAALEALPGIREAVAVVREDVPGRQQLVAYVVAAHERAVGAPAAADVRARLAERLPAGYVPAAIVLLDALPLTPSGKLDRRALPAPAPTAADDAPLTADEQQVANVFAALLGVQRIHRDDDFFALGGHSLLATQAIARLRASTGRDLPLQMLFDAPTVATLAARVASAPRTTSTQYEPHTGDAPLSYAQERLWFLHRLTPDDAAYHLPAVFELCGPLDLPALGRSLNLLVARHASLRTAIVETAAGPVQQVAASCNLPLVLADGRAMDEDRRAAWLRAAVETPFDLAQAPLVRAHLLRTDTDTHTLAIVLHHIIADGWSTALLLRELSDTYAAFIRGDLPSLAPVPHSYAAHARNQRSAETGPELEYWRTALAGVPQSLDLPTDAPRVPLGRRAGGVVRAVLPAPVVARLHALAHQQDATLFMAVLTVFEAMLMRYSGQTAFLVGTPIAGRTDAATEPLVGMFVNTLAIPADLTDRPDFVTALARTRVAALGAYAHQQVPFELVVEALQPARDVRLTPLFQTMFVYQNTPTAALTLPGVDVRDIAADERAAKFDLTLFVREQAGELLCELEYDRDLFSAATAGQMLRHTLALAAAATSTPARPLVQLPLLSAPERAEVLRQSVSADSAPAPQHVVAQLLAQADRTPGALALQMGEECWNYAELVAQVLSQAAALRDAGVGPERRVALLLPRSPQMVLAVLAVLAAGGAYVPLDPDAPQARLAALLADAAPVVVLSDRADVPAGAWAVLRPDTLVGQPAPWQPPAADTLAYILYTSGSTGMPKGVMVPHSGLAHYLGWAASAYGLQPGMQVPFHTPLTFDLSITSLLVPLVAGATVVVIPDGPGVEGLVQGLRAGQHWDVLKLTPAHLALLQPLLSAEEAARIGMLVVGGEALRAEQLRRWQDDAPATVVVNEYGPTETVVGCAVARWPAAQLPAGPLPIGTPIDRTALYVLDADMQPVPAGVAGELYVGGAGVTRGYLSRPALTAERFVPDPFSITPGARLYRTGDVVARRHDATLIYLGRADEQVKLRGVRIEPGEVSAVAERFPAVAAAVAVVREDAGDRRLVLYAVPHTPGLDAGALRAFLREQLPTALLPAAMVELGALPLTRNGKIDRRALPAPTATDTPGEDAPQSAEEATVMRLWAETLGRPVGRTDDFFAVGGHSLLATQLIARVRAELGIDLPLRTVFDAPTVAAFAAHTRAARQTQRPPLVPQPRPAPLPLSFAQERLWFLHQLDPTSAAYHIPLVLRLRGTLHVQALADSLTALIARHEALRTVFPLVGALPVQQVLPAAAVALPVRDLAGQPADEPAIAALLVEETNRPFDLERGPLVRALLIKQAEDDHTLLLVLHHIISDGWSMGVLARELTRQYATQTGLAPDAPAPLPVQYADYTLWQRHWLASGSDISPIEEQLAYWKRQLAGAPPILDLPTDYPRPAARSGRGSRVPVVLPPTVVAQMMALCTAEQATPFMALLAALQVLLMRLSGQNDISVGAPVANRTSAATEDLIGFFVNTLVMRADLSEDLAFRALLRQVRQTALDAYAHQDAPFEQVVDAVQPLRDLRYTPLFQTVLVLQNAPRADLALPGLQAQPVDIHGGIAKFDLTLYLNETAEGYTGWLEYDTDLFTAATAERIAGQFGRMVAACVAAPEQPVRALPLLSDAERDLVLRAWNDTATAYPQTCIHTLIDAQAAAHPDAVALRFGAASMRYGELVARANQLAHHLQAQGVGPDVPVAIYMARSLDLIVAMLAVLKAGGAYVPIDPNYPDERIGFVFADTRPPLVLTDDRDRMARVIAHTGESSLAHLPVFDVQEDWAQVADLPTTPPAAATTPDHLAYVIFTSGSTGRPKGVMVPHRAGVRLVQNMTYATYRPDDVFFQFSSIAFDTSIIEIWGSLTNGASLVIFPPHIPTMHELGQAIVDGGVTTLWLTVGIFHQLMQEYPAALRNVRQVMTGGDVVGVPQAITALRELGPDAVLINGYGPTENGTYTTCYVMHDAAQIGQSVPIGVPMSNTRTYILDARMQPVPVGVAGELYTSGDGLARGYFSRPALTAERFVPHPFSDTPGARLYRIGDMARYRADGVIEFLGRIDNQIKLRGFRIELGEIEAALRVCASVSEAVVIVRETSPGDKRLVAYVVPEAAADQQQLADTLRAELRTNLPDYMVPAAFVALPALPLTPNGKIDRRALPEPVWDAGAAAVAPRTPTETALVDIWAEVLNLPTVGVTDSFFAVGGHSLLATQVMARVRQQFAVELPLRTLFERPTIAEFAETLDATRPTPATASAIVPGRRDGPLPLSFSQQRLWLLDQIEPGNPAYHIPVVVRLRGTLDREAWQRSMAEVVRRHMALRVRFGISAGQPYQEVLPTLDLAQPYHDLRGIAPEQQAAQLQQYTGEAATQPFDLSRGPLLRTRLLRTADDDHTWLLTMHHIITDGWSMYVLLRELQQLYAAFVQHAPSPLPELAIQYPDVVHWQQDWFRGDVREQQLGYWKERLSGAPPVLDLPTDRARGAVRTFTGAQRTRTLDAALATQVRALSSALDASPFMTLLAAFKVVLARLSGQTDIVIGTPIAGRTRAELEPLIGFFLNTLVLRTDIDLTGDFRTAVRHVRQTALDAYAHQDVPFEQVLDALHLARDLSYTPLFQVFFNMLNMPRDAASLPGMALELQEPPQIGAKFDLTMYVEEQDGTYALTLAYNADLFDAGRMDDLLEQFAQVVQAGVAAPEQPVQAVSLLTPRARAVLPDPTALLDATWRGSIPDALTAHARATPDRVAIEDPHERWTYAELEGRANRLAHRLQASGVGAEDVVAIYAHRSATLVWAVLGALKAGAAFLILDPAYPPSRIITYLELAQPRAFLHLTDAGPLPDALAAHIAGRDLVCHVALPRYAEAAPLVASFPDTPPAHQIGPDSLACIGFTSGSTGLPKGIAGRHGPLTHFIPWQQSTFGLSDADRFSMLSGIAHDPLQRDMFTPIWLGAAICIPDQEHIRAPARLLQWMHESRISVSHLTPALAQILTEAATPGGGATIPSLRFAFIVGDVLTRKDVARIRQIAPAIDCVNLYGSTETQRAVSFYRLSAEHTAISQMKEVLPLGKGMCDVQLLVLAASGQQAGIGEVGEIVMRSPHLARGYLGDAAFSASRFVANPFTGAPDDRMYRTGDLGRYMPDGNVEFFGRADQQVKIRGFRVELGEIEAAIGRQGSIRDAVVIAREDTPGDKRLVGYVVPVRPTTDADGQQQLIAALRDDLKARLPAYMVPAALVVLERLPLTPNGKIDRRALPAPQVARTHRAAVAPQSELERMILAIWSEVLHTTDIDVDDSFFDLGGNSLQIVQVHSKLAAALGRDLPVIDLFVYPTVRTLAQYVREASAPPRPETPAPERMDVQDRIQKQRQALERQKRLRKG